MNLVITLRLLVLDKGLPTLGNHICERMLNCLHNSVLSSVHLGQPANSEMGAHNCSHSQATKAKTLSYEHPYCYRRERQVEIDLPNP
jgi:hypothetical protein